MSDLISRADAIEAVCKWGTNEERKGNLTMTMVSVKQCVADILSALQAEMEIPSDKTVVHVETYRRLYEKYVDLKNNAVKVVKCKNCRYRFYDKYNDCYMCDRHEYGESFEDDDYCSWGERREE